MELLEQIMLLYALRNGALDELTPAVAREFCGNFYSFLQRSHARLLETIVRGGWTLTEAVKQELDSLLEGYLVTLVSKAKVSHG